MTARDLIAVIGQAGTCVALDPELKAMGRQNWAGVGTNYQVGIGVRLEGGQNELSIQPASYVASRVDGQTHCFSGDTMVLALDDGGNSIKVPISNLAPGMQVLSLPEDEIEELIGLRGSIVDEIGDFSKLIRHLAPKKITKVHIHEGSHSGMIKLQVTGGTIDTTPEHPFFVLGMGWIPAGSLKPKDTIFSLGYSMVEVLGVASRPSSGKVYNITVEDFHTYFIFAKGQDDPILVHNKGAIPE